MSDVVIVAYRPKPGREDALRALVADHAPALRRLGLATDRPAIALQARDGVLVEMFEWKPGAIKAAHQHPDVQEMWARFAEACDYVPLKELPEASDLFAEFKPLEPASLSKR